MMKFRKVIFVFLFAIISILLSQTVLADTDNPDMPEYCLLLLDSDETLSNTTVVVDGVSQIEPKTKEELPEYHILLPRADNGRGNGTIHYSNPLLPVGGEHEYALVQYWNIDGENQPYDGAEIYPGVVDENGELIFSISELAYGCNLFLCKVLTIEEVDECNQYLENEIDTSKLFVEDGFVYLPLKDFGVTDSFALRIQAASDTSTNNGAGNPVAGNDDEDDDPGDTSGGISNDTPDAPVVIDDDDCNVGTTCD